MRLDVLDYLVYFLVNNIYEMGFTDILPIKVLPTCSNKRAGEAYILNRPNYLFISKSLLNKNIYI